MECWGACTAVGGGDIMEAHQYGSVVSDSGVSNTVRNLGHKVPSSEACVGVVVGAGVGVGVGD